MDRLFPEPGQGGSAVAGEYVGGSEAQPFVSRAFASMDPRWEPKGPFSRMATPFTACQHGLLLPHVHLGIFHDPPSLLLFQKCFGFLLFFLFTPV